MVIVKSIDNPKRCMLCEGQNNRQKDRNGRWKGGITPLNQQIRRSRKVLKIVIKHMIKPIQEEEQRMANIYLEKMGQLPLFRELDA